VTACAYEAYSGNDGKEMNQARLKIDERSVPRDELLLIKLGHLS